jgi:acyl carrier protein
MTKNELIETVNGFLIDEFEVDAAQIIPESNLQEALDLDSLDYVDLVVVIESNFGVKLTGEDFKSIVTLQNFYDFLCEKTNCA